MKTVFQFKPMHFNADGTLTRAAVSEIALHDAKVRHFLKEAHAARLAKARQAYFRERGNEREKQREELKKSLSIWLRSEGNTFEFCARAVGMSVNGVRTVCRRRQTLQIRSQNPLGAENPVADFEKANWRVLADIASSICEVRA